MKVIALVGFLALLGYASAQCCGCSRVPQGTTIGPPTKKSNPILFLCSKHLTIGKTVPTGGCGPATVIYRDAPSWSGADSLSYRMQIPATVAPAKEQGAKDLTCRIISSPCGCVNLKAGQPLGVRYDTKIEVPVPVPGPTQTSTTVNLKPCLDKVIVPASQHGGPLVRGLGLRGDDAWGYGGSVHDGAVYGNHLDLDGHGYVNGGHGYVNAGRGAELLFNSVGTLSETPVYVNTVRKTPAYGCGTEYVVRNPPPIYVNSGRCCGSPIRKIISRYGRSVSPLSVTRGSLASCEGKGSVVPSRSKREIPLLTHGYKFVMNMLPKFVQEPIRNTVNGLALTHPDKRLQRVYNQPRKPTLKEKLQMQKERRLAVLRNSIRQRQIRNNLNTIPYFNHKGLDRERLTQPYKFSSRSKIIKDDTRSDPHFYRANLPTYLGSFNRNNKLDKSVYSSRDFRDENVIDYLGKVKVEPRKQKLTEVEKALLMVKLRKLVDDKNRFKRSPAYEKYWLHKYKRPSSSKSVSRLLRSSDIVLPFYHIKEENLEDGSSFNYDYQYADPWEESLKSPLNKDLQNFRYRRQGDTYNFLEPYTFRHASAENHNIREDFLRNVVRDELRKNQIQNQGDYYEESYFTKKTPPLSPLFHVITFPMRVMKKINDVTKQAFPEMGSLPKVITGTKKYFRDFGKNFRKNVLHLTSDLIGDFENLEVTNGIFGPSRQRRSTRKSKKTKKCRRKSKKRPSKGLVSTQYEPDYSLVFCNEHQEDSNGKIRRKRYILKMVDEEEIESYLLENLGEIFFDNPDTPTHVKSSTSSKSNPNYWSHHNDEEQAQKKYVLEQLKPKIILDNNGRPFLEINGYKRPVWKKPTKLKKSKLKTKKSSFKKLRYFDSSEEIDSERIASLIDHAKDHVENNLKSVHSEIPIKTIKEKISQLLFETDVLVHMDFEKYDDIYDDLIALQHVKTSIVQDWKRLIMSKTIHETEAKISLLERFKELQHYKDLTLSDIVASLGDDHENMFLVKKLIKMLVRLQKLQCIINQVVSNFHDHLHISSKSEIEREIKYVDFLNGLNFASEKSRNDLVAHLKKDREVALQRNIILLDKLKKLLMYEIDSDKVEEEAELLWEMKNIEKMQRATIEDLTHRLDAGYKIKKELKILFDLLKRYESCEADQRRLLSKFEKESDETEEEEDEESSEEVGKKLNRNKKHIVAKRKLHAEKLKAKWQERLKKRKMLLKKKLKRKDRRLRKKSDESDEDD